MDKNNFEKNLAIEKEQSTKLIGSFIILIISFLIIKNEKNQSLIGISFIAIINIFLHVFKLKLLSIFKKDFSNNILEKLRIVSQISSFIWGLFFANVLDSTNFTGMVTIILFMAIAASHVTNLNYKKNDTLFELILLSTPVLISIVFVYGQLNGIILGVILIGLMCLIWKQNIDYNNEWDNRAKKQIEMQNIVNAFPGGISIIEDNEYKMINQTILDMTGLNPNKILNNKIGKNNPKDSLVIALNEFRESNKVVFQKEISLNIKGIAKSFLLILKKFDTDTKQILSITIDIEEQKKMRAELEQQKIKLQNSAKLASLGEMASGISHEINNPLQIVGGRAEILREEINDQEQLDPEFKARMSKGLKSIEDMSARIAKIIKGLKTFARNAENDPMDICSLEDIVQDTLSFCNQRFQKNNIEFDYINECKEFQLKGRATQLSQVLLNLLNNSFDAIMEKPKINSFIHLKITKDQNGFAVITVTDNGTGISAEFKEKIMTPFQTTKPVGKGTGLGLSISRGIVEDHGGNLQFDFDKSDTTVFFTLPEYNA